MQKLIKNGDVIREANGAKGDIDIRYDMSLDELLCIQKEYSGVLDGLACAFRLGFVRGVKKAGDKDARE